MRLNLFLSALVLLLLSIVPAAAEKRVALVIGNGAYANAPKLPNPRNDADDISAALKRTGFETIVGVDLDKSGMDNAAIRFARAARDADVAVFYYSGHAMQFAGVNYLMPVDAKLADEADLRLMVRTDSIVADLQQARNLRILVLDSCRDNPLAEELKRSIGRTRAGGISRGLAKIDTPEGTIVAYATQANKTAEDGTGRNSPYTAAFLKHIEQRDEIGTIFRRISADVYETTKRTQLPELSLSLIGEFYLKGLPASAVAPADAERAREIAALQEQLRDMQEQIKKRDAAAVAPAAPAASAPSPTQKQIVVTPSGMPPPPEPAPVELGERASKQSAVAPIASWPSFESAPIELGAAAAKQAKADPYNLPPPPVPPLIEFGQQSVSRPQAPPVAATRPAARDPYDLPPPPVPAPVELGAAAAQRVTADPYNLPPLPEAALVELGVQGAKAATGNFVVTVSSLRSEADARSRYRALQGKYPGLLGSRSAWIRRADTGGKNSYQAMVGPFSSPDDANRLCGSLKAAGGQCEVIRN